MIATGLLVGEAVKAADALKAEGISVRVIDMHTIKPLDKELVLKAAKETGKIITAEEHNVIGGLGDAVASVLAEELPTPLVKIGVNDEFGYSGPATELLKEFGLCASHIQEVVKENAWQVRVSKSETRTLPRFRQRAWTGDFSLTKESSVDIMREEILSMD